MADGFFDNLFKVVAGAGDAVAGGVPGAVGGIAGAILGTVQKYLPPDMSPEQKAQMALAVQAQGFQHEKDVAAALHDAEQDLNGRIAAYEGTASDLKAIPVLGPVMLFARGAQRPVWGFGALFLDYQVFSGAWILKEGTQVAGAFYVINFLVLGFLFGERAVKNVAPFITQMISAKGGGAP
jgi:hypothetical protein